MGIRTAIQRFTAELRGDPLNNPAVPLSAAGFLSWTMGGEPTASGEEVNLTTALQQNTVYACTRIISESVASLPLKVYERLDKGRQEAADHPLAWLLAVEPNPEMSAFTFWEAMVGALALTGNCYAEIQRDKGGRTVGVWPLHPQLTTPKRNSAGELVYETTDGMQPGKFRIVAASNMLHIPLFSFDGLKGLSPIQLARQGIGLARASEKFGARFFGNGAKPGGVLSTDSQIDDVAMRAVRESWEKTQGGSNQGRTAVLPGNWKYEQIGISPEDSQFLQTRQFQRAEIAALFRIDPHMVGDTTRMSNSNHEQQALQFVTDTLRPYLCRLEAEIARKLLPDTGRNAGRYFIRFDVSERLRGDFKTTMDGLAVAKQWGLINTNDGRESLGMNPIGPEGDVYWVPVNMQNAARLLDTESIQDQPVGEDPADPSGDPPKPQEQKQLPAPASEDKRSLSERYAAAYAGIFRDAFGRLMQRNKRDYGTISALFTPVLRGIGGMLESQISGNSMTLSSILDKHSETVCRSMAKRAEGYTIADDIDALAQQEFVKAVRSIHINAHRDAAAAAAEATL